MQKTMTKNNIKKQRATKQHSHSKRVSDVPEVPSHLTAQDVSLLAEITPRRVYQLTNEGVLKRDSTGEYPFIPTAKALIEYYRAKNEGSDNNRYLTARAELMEAKVEEAKKRFLRRDEVLFGVNRIYSIVAAEVDKMPEEIAGQIAAKGAKDQDEVAEVMRECVIKSLGTISANIGAEFAP
jgi:hypothetical protein